MKRTSFKVCIRQHLRSLAISCICLFLLVVVTIDFIEPQLESRRLHHLEGIFNTVGYIGACKDYAVWELRLSNGATLRAEDFLPYMWPGWIVENEKLGHIKCNNESSYLVTLEPVGTDPKMLFLRPFLGHPAGYEISSSCAEIMGGLYKMDLAKRDLCRKWHWKSGRLVSPKEMKRVRLLNDLDVAIKIVPNAVGVPPVAKVVKPWPGLPVGLEIGEDGPHTK